MNDAKASRIAAKFIFIMFLLLFGLNVIRISDFNIDSGTFQNFSIIFISILLDAFPFILLGAFVSSVLHVFVSEELIERIIPKNRLLGTVAASLCGIIFPICECAIVPIAHRLIKKGVPAGIAVTFMLAVPIVNPVVLISTYYAFSDRPLVVLIRAVFGMVCAVLIGLIIEYIWHGKTVIKNVEYDNDECCCKNCGHEIKNKRQIFFEVMEHTGMEFYGIGKLLIIGSLISAAVQTFISKNIFLNLSGNITSSIIVMMVMAYVLSICSEADAFVGRSFYPAFNIGAICSFLIMGPMIDIKNTIMLFTLFKKKFVFELMLLIVFMAFISGYLICSFGL